MNQPENDWPDTQDWPGCPNPHRLRAAIAAAREVTGEGTVQIPPEHDEDLDRGLELTTGNTLFARHTKGNYLLHRRRVNPGPGSREETDLLAIHASAADTNGTIGLAVLKRDGETSFSRLLRDAGWSGACTALPQADGLEATIHESRTNPGRPGAVTLTPEAHPAAGKAIPNGLATTIAFICRWHGARSCRWLPRPPKTPAQPAGQGRIV